MLLHGSQFADEHKTFSIAVNTPSIWFRKTTDKFPKKSD